jgi:cell volume regulation protein A
LDSYILIIISSVLVIVSYLFSELSRKTGIPSVVMLIFTGMILNEIGILYDVPKFNFFPYLEILGVIGLIVIVLEGALDLELTKDHLPMVKKSFFLALLGILASVSVIAVLLKYFFAMEWGKAILYATPLSIISSAIVIPSVINSSRLTREFLTYESTLSDILGILAFYFMVEVLQSGDLVASGVSYTLSFLGTTIISILLSLGLIITFRFLKGRAKLFLFIAILVLIYSLGKTLHLSALVLILVFGLILKNHSLIFKGRLANLATSTELNLMERNFHFITVETAFILRTFFFIVFGLTIDLKSLPDLKVFSLSFILFELLFLIRLGLSKLIVKENLRPAVFIAPRGLITVLLFYSIPADLQSDRFDPNIILWVVILSSLLMAYGLIGNRIFRWDKRPVSDEI